MLGNVIETTWDRWTPDYGGLLGPSGGPVVDPFGPGGAQGSAPGKGGSLENAAEIVRASVRWKEGGTAGTGHYAGGFRPVRSVHP